MFRLRQREVIHKFIELIHRHFAQIPDIFSAEIDGKSLFFQALAAADSTGRRAHIAFDIVFHAVRGGLGIPPLEIDHEALPGGFVAAAERTGLIA